MAERDPVPYGDVENAARAKLQQMIDRYKKRGTFKGALKHVVSLAPGDFEVTCQAQADGGCLLKVVPPAWAREERKDGNDVNHVLANAIPMDFLAAVKAHDSRSIRNSDGRPYVFSSWAVLADDIGALREAISHVEIREEQVWTRRGP